MDYPLVSLTMVTYKHEAFIRETLEGAVSQDYPNLEIIISDDCSPDRTYEIMEEFKASYHGPHKLIINRNAKNLGPGGNCRLVAGMVHGEYVFGVDGDNVCLPYAVSTAMKAVREHDLDLLTLNYYIINAKSEVTGRCCDEISDRVEVFEMKDYLANKYLGMFGACRLIKTDIFKTFGFMSEKCQTGDSTTLLRGFLYGKVGYCYTPVINYRIHGANISSFHSLMTVINPVETYNQYKRDIETAFAKKMITKDVYDRLQVRIEDYVRCRVAMQKLYAKKNLPQRVAYALTYLFRPGFSPRNVHWLIGLAREWHKKGV